MRFRFAFSLAATLSTLVMTGSSLAKTPVPAGAKSPASSVAIAPKPKATAAETITVPPVTAKIWTLPDGLTVIVQEDHSAPVASVQAWCETGSIDEDKHLGAGLSHILEHMLFKGTPTRNNSEFAQAVQNAGGYINAYTSYDRTVYWIDIPSKGAATAVELLSDAMMNSTLPAEEYTKEQEVIRREFAMGYDDPDRMSGLKLFEVAYSQHPYRIPVIGHMEIYDKLTRDDVMAYYKARYVPNNLSFVIVGDVDAEKIHTQLETYFAKYPRKSLPPHFIPQEPPQLGKRESHTEFPTKLTRLSFAWHAPAITHPDVPALDLLGTILGDGRSARLYQKLREKLGLVHSISAYSYSPGEPGLFGIEAALDPENRDATEKAVLESMEEIKKAGVSGEELEKAKRKTLNQHLNALTTMRGKASDLGSNWLLTRNLNFSNEYLAAIQRVTVADISRVLHTYFDEANLSVVSLNPQGSLTRESEKVAAVSAGEIQKFDLANGLRLLVREDPRLPLVSMVATFKAGLLVETPQDAGITKIATRVMTKGTKTRNAEQIATTIETLGGSITQDAGNNSFNVGIKVMQPDTKIGLAILSDILVNPTFPQNEVAREKQIQLAGIKAEDEEVTTIARNLLRANLFPDHPYGLRASGTPESIGAIDRQKLVDFHRKYVVGKNGVIAVFGDVKAAAVKALVEQAFGALPAGEPALTNAPQPAALAASKIVEATKPDAKQAILMVGFRGTDLFSEDREELGLIDEACSDLGSRFFIRIREKMGLAYFVGSSQVPGLVTGPFAFYVGTSPEKVDAVKPELLDEIGKLAREGLTAEELARAKEKVLGQQDIRNQSNDAFAYACALDELYGLGFGYYKTLRAKVEGVTLEDMKRVANKYFQDQPEVTAIVRPEAKPAPPKTPSE